MIEPIAVVGSSCRFPGGASSPSKLWQLLKNPKDVLRKIPKDRLSLGAFYHEDGEHHGCTNVVDKAYLLDEDPRLFDAPFFNINPMEADAMDPQQRLLLESVYECIETAGYPLEQMQGSATSVYVGCMTNDYHDIQGRDLEIVNRYHGTGSTQSILSNRISYFFDFRGPSVTMDTACSSSLAALHFAVQSLRTGESKSSIVGGVNLIFDSVSYISESKLHMLSPTSRSSMWDASADGYARGEGVSTIMLKTLSQAVADGDNIECIIRETGMNQDGRTTGLTMPSGERQASLIRETYARAGLDLRRRSDRPQYFEAHGTGTLAGDPQEARGIYDAFFGDCTLDEVDKYQEGEEEYHEKLFCGSIKTVIGHLEGCAGLAGLLKASLAVQNGEIPQNLLFNTLNPDIAPYYHRLQVPTTTHTWPSGTAIRRASVNSFGFGGTNVHAIIEQYVPSPSTSTPTTQLSSDVEDCLPGPLLLSACSETSLALSAERLADMLEENSTVRLEHLGFFTQTRRTTFQHRTYVPGGSRIEVIDSLRTTGRSTAPSEVGVRAPAKLKWHTPGILGIFTGQGAQWATMGRELLHRCHLFRESIRTCEAALHSLPDAPKWSLARELIQETSESRLHEAELSQPLCTAVQIALVDVLAAAGVTFRGVVGHSSGEIAATYAAGLLSAEDAMRVAFYRGRHAHLAQGPQGQQGAMLAVGLGLDDAEAFCQRFGGRLSVAASNSPTSTTLSGDKDAVMSAKESLEEDKLFARLLKVDTAYHSSHMFPCAGPYRESLKACNIRVRPQNDQCIWISSVYGHAELLDYPEDLETLVGEYWVANMCQPVLFSEAVECSLWRAGPFDLAVEVGAHPALKGPATQTITAVLGAKASLPYTATLQRGRNDLEAFSASLGNIWSTLGTWVDFRGWRKAYLGSESTVTVPKGLPSYSWSHEQVYWKESRLSNRYRLAERPPGELLGRRAPDDSDNEMRWRNIMKVNELPWIKGHVFQKAILFPTVGYVALAIEAAAEIVGAHRIKLVEIRDLTIPRALVLEDNNNGVETVFSLQRRPCCNDESIEADFACHSSVNGGALEKNCGGRLIVELFPSGNSHDDCEGILLPARCPPRSGTTSLDGESYYQAVYNTTGLDYQGLFRGMKHIRRSLGFSSARASWAVEDVGDRYLLHPGLLDVALQAILAAFVNPTRIPIRGSFLPSALSRMVFDPHTRTLSDDGKEVVFESDCFLTMNTARSIEGDIHVFGPSSQCLLQVEGFRMDNWTEPSAAEDRPVFSRLEYQPDLFYANANNLPELVPDDAELRLIEAINRSSFYYLRTSFSGIDESVVAGWTWDRQAFYKAVRNVLQQTSNGSHPTAQKSWAEDTASLMEEYKQTPEFKDQADMKAIHVAGDHLAQVLAGDERPLENYLRENVWAPLYSHGRYQIQLNRTIADLMRKFAHRYPRANILEVGAGSGGTTLSVLDQIGDAVGQYTFTDVSAGFFEKARERLAQTKASVERVTYKVLDIERDPLEQGFEAESQDAIIAANVLHATSDLTKAVQNVRKLLKPGGYLFMLEVTGEYLEGLLLMGPLEGWWLGNKEGKASQPGLTLQGWDDLFRDTGFTGVDMHQSDVPDSTTQAVSVIVTQATDSRVDILRDPIEHLDDVPVIDQVLIIGGESLAISKTVRTISQYLARFAGRVQIAKSIDKINAAIHTSARTAVIALCDLERPFFADPVNETRLQKLQALFAQATDVLWVTTGHLDEKDPSSAMMIGLCRTVVIELEQLNLQFLNTTTQPDARFVVEAFIRLRLGSSDGFAASPILWSVEPELTLTPEGEVSIPRLKPDVERNNRINSAARHITKTASCIDNTSYTCTAASRDGFIHLEEDSPWLLSTRRQLAMSDSVTIRTTLSVALPHSSSAILVTGLDNEDKPVVALANAHASSISVPRALTLYLEDSVQLTAQKLRRFAQLITAQHILAAIPSRTSLKEPHVVVHGCSTALALITNKLNAGRSSLIFTQTTTTSKSHGNAVISLHPRSSTYILQRSLPASIGYVLALTGNGDPVASKLLSVFRGTKLEIDVSLQPAEFQDLYDRLSNIYGEDEDAEGNQLEPMSAHLLPRLPATTLDYPNVIDWAVNREHPLTITVNPIHGRGLFSGDKTYFMVSLVSTLGRSICRWMVENGARHIALASRSANVDLQWLEEMAHLGAEIRVYRMDVSNKQSVETTVATIRNEMPPIAGVANAALVLRDGLFLHMKASDMTEVLAPKVDGSLYLHEAFKDPTLDFFILFSTLSCVIGNAGQSNYDAASLYQVMLAKHRRQQGLAASVMQVGCVADVGYVAERGQSLFDKLARTMKLPLSESDVHQIFAEAVAASPVREGEVVDSTTAEIVTGMGHYTYNASTASEAHPPWFNNLLASHYVREECGSSVLAGEADAGQLSVAARLDTTTTEEAAALVLTQALAGRVETMLQMSAGSFKIDASLLDVGIDSLLAVELRTWFLKEIHVDVPVLKILSGESGENICAFAAGQYVTEKSKLNTASSSSTTDVDAASPESAKEGVTSSSSSDVERSSSLDSTDDTADSPLATSVSTLDGESKDEAVEQETDHTPAIRHTAPMTHAQARIWVADHMSSNPTQNNNVLTYAIHGFLHVARLRRAIATVLAHHPGLHTCFFQDATSTPMQGLLDTPLDCFKHHEALAGNSEDTKIVEVVQDRLRTRKWRLSLGEVLEIILISHTSSEHTLLIGYHHIAMDGSAWRTFFRDLHTAYQGALLQAPGKSLIEQAENEATHTHDVSSTFWRQHLSPQPEPISLLPFASVKARPRLDDFTNYISLVQVDRSIADRISAISRSLGVTSVNFYLAAVQYLLSRLTEADDLCIGITDAGRDAETAESVGFFLNLLPLRLRGNSSRSFRELTQQANKTYREARANSEIPFDKILDEVGASRDPTYTPLFQVGFDVRHGQSAEMPLGNCKMKIRDSVDSALPYDIAFCIIPMPAPGPSFVQIVTRTDLYSQEATDLLAHMYVALLKGASLASAADLPLRDLRIYPEAGIQKALAFGTPSPKTFPGWPTTLTERVDQMCRDYPTTIAVKDIAGSLSYVDLSSAAKSLSARIYPHRKRRIAVLCEPRREWIIGMLAVLRIGATFISFDATLPPSRLVAMVQACEPSAVLYQAATKALAAQVMLESGSSAELLSLEETHNVSNQCHDADNLEDPSQASFMLCTSGTTGIPKAILLSSQGFLNSLANKAEKYGLHHGDVVLQKSSLGFDMALAESLLALTHGCTLVIAPQASRGDPVAITDLMAQEDITLTIACPTEYLMWLRYGSDTLSRSKSWRLAQSGGEKVTDALRREIRNLRHSPVFWDAYGPTEISICATMQCDEEVLLDDPLTPGAPSVGRPLHNVGIFILDSYGHVCPPGIPGEICVTGPGVALGYVDADATAQSFVDSFEVDCGQGHALHQGRMFKTGDRGVWRADGTLGFLGRMADSMMVKIRGLRVDLADVESTVLSQGIHLISDVVVTLDRRDEEDAYLVAHVVPVRESLPTGGSREVHDIAERGLQESLEDFMHQLALSRHMHPSRVVVHTTLPMTANGKVDRRKLSNAFIPPRPRHPQEPDNAANMTTLKQVELHLLWSQVLNRPDVPRRTDIDFWAMGGSSLHLVKLQSAIRTEMLVDISIRDMFMHSTLGAMADLVSDRTAARPPSKPIDWDAETSLPNDLIQTLASTDPPHPPRNPESCTEILLTGADGFLGNHILQALLRHPSIQKIHCLAVPSTTSLPPDIDLTRITLYKDSSLHKPNLGLDPETSTALSHRLDRIIIAGSHGHCLHHYASLRYPNLISTKTLTIWAARRRVPIHFVSSGRVTLLPRLSSPAATSTALPPYPTALPPISVKAHPPPVDGSQGLTASKWAAEVFLERVAAETQKHKKKSGSVASPSPSFFPITIHRPCALIAQMKQGEKADEVGHEVRDEDEDVNEIPFPSEDALNAILKFSNLLHAVPQFSTLPVAVTGFWDFKFVGDVAGEIVRDVICNPQERALSFRHYSSGRRITPGGFKREVERIYGMKGGRELGEMEVGEWIRRAKGRGLEVGVGVYLNAVFTGGGGGDGVGVGIGEVGLELPFMGAEVLGDGENGDGDSNEVEGEVGG